MSGINIRVIEDQQTEEKLIENPEEVIEEYKRSNGINQNPFISEEDQVKSFLNKQNNNDQNKFVPTNNTHSYREVKVVDVTDDFKIQIEIRTDMPDNKGF